MEVSVIETRDGPMRALVGDRFITRSLELYGEYGRHERELFDKLVNPGMVAVDAGANIGCFTLPLATRARQVYAFEPQQPLFQLLCANLSMNGLTNVTALPHALGAKAGWTALPSLNYGVPGNYGSVTPEGESGTVPVTALDDLALPELHFMKIDVEGWEASVIKGASGTIQRCRPVLYVENDRAKLQGELIGLIDGLGYDQYWHVASLYHPGNFRGLQENVLQVASLNMLCMPKERGITVGGLEIIDPGNWRSPIAARPD